MSDADDETPEQDESTTKEPTRFRMKLALQKEEIELEGEDGSVRVFTLLEMDGGERDRYLTSQASRVRVNSEGHNLGVRNFDKIYADLICRCLWTDQGKLVTDKMVQKWPSSVQEAIFRKCQVMNALGGKAKDDEKNE